MKTVHIKITSSFDKLLRDNYQKTEKEIPYFLIFSVDKHNYIIEDVVEVPEKAYVRRTSDKFTIDPRFILYMIKYCKSNNKGLGIIHNHFNNNEFSRYDLDAEKIIREVLNEYDINEFINGLFAMEEYKFRVFHSDSSLCNDYLIKIE